MTIALVAQGGGPTAVINNSMVGVVREARQYGKVYGALHGIEGILKEDFIDLTRVTDSELVLVGLTPGAALRSTRDKADDTYCRKIFEVLRAHGITHFYYIGGNDTSGTLLTVSSYARAVGYLLRCVHVPKTVDNDVVGNDHTPGFPSAGRFITQAFVGLNLDNASLPGIHIAVVMGRNAGWLTAASAFARTESGDGPHLIYIPERIFDVDKFLDDVKRCYERHGRVLVAVSEGIHDASGSPILSKLVSDLESDPHGNAQLSGTGALADLLCEQIKSNLNIKRVRGDTLGYLQRSFSGCVSGVDSREAYEVGVKAVQFGMAAGRDGSVVIGRSYPYAANYCLVALDEVANKTRVMPEEFIGADGTSVTPAFIEYLRPLLGPDMPKIHRLSAPPVEKILNKK